MPLTNAGALERALSLFREDDHGLHLAGHTQNLEKYVRQRWRDDDQRALIDASTELGSIGSDLWSISTVLDRLEWMRTEANRNEYLRSRWSYYAAVDIQSVHVDVRSILDYVAGVTPALFSMKPGQAPGSFRKLLDWVDDHPSRIDVALRELLLEQRRWFGQARAARDSLVHSGAHTTVFGSPEEGILFQIYGRHFSGVSEPGLMWNENVAYFDRYFALTFARLLCFLDDFGALAKARLGAADIPSEFGTRSYHPGFVITRTWMTNFLAHLLASSTAGPDAG